MEQETDEEIAVAVQRGEVHRFGLLVERYEQKLLRYARKFLLQPQDAEDLVQDIFLKAYQNLQGFDASRVFSPWIYRIAHNEFINAIKKRGKEPLPFFDPDTLFPHPTAPHAADHEVASQELKAMLDECLERLDPKYREPLVLYYYEDMDYRQIAEILHIPISTAGVRISRGKQVLQSIYQALHKVRE